MSLKNQPIDAYEFQERVYGRIVHGNFQRVANLTKKHRSQHSREWNPDEPQNPPVIEACEELAAWHEAQPEIFEMQAELLTDTIVRLRAAGEPGQAGDKLTMKRACDELTTAMQMDSEEDEYSAMVKLHALLDSRLRHRPSPVERCRMVGNPAA